MFPGTTRSVVSGKVVVYNTNHPQEAAITAESVAAVVDGTARVARQPLGTWMTRWSAIYLDAPAVARDIDPEDRLTLPRYVVAA